VAIWTQKYCYLGRKMPKKLVFDKNIYHLLKMGENAKNCAQNIGSREKCPFFAENG
jgi:hypothetical protein